MAESEMDWNDLVSSQIPSLSNDSPWTRSIGQLQSSSQSFLQQQTSGAQNPVSAPSLFGSLSQQSTALAWNGDPSSVIDGPVQQLSRNQTATAPVRSGRTLESLEDMLARMENEIIDNLTTRTAEETRETVDSLVEKQLQAAWERDRDRWIRDVIGKRHLGGASGNAIGTGSLQQHGTFGNRLVIAPDSQQSKNIEGLSSLHFGNRLGNSTQKNNFDPTLAKKHLNVLKESMPAVRIHRNGRLLPDVLDLLYRIVIDSAPEQHRDNGAQIAYASSLKLLSELVKVTSPSSPVEQAKAALIHLCKQFNAHVRKIASSSLDVGNEIVAMDNQAIYRSSVANQCSIFTKLEFGMTMADQDQIWATVYYCLRCGDFSGASEVMQKNQSFASASDAPILRILAAMARAQGHTDCLWESSFPQLSLDDLLAVNNLLENAKRQESTEIHRLGVYTLLSRSGHPETSATVPGFKTIEDYLVACLFKSFLQENPTDEIGKLGNFISEDPNHFDDGTSGGWSFAIPLLVTQQYQTALTCLVNTGGAMGLLSATHIGLILSSAGISIRNHGSNSSLENSDECFLSTLLVAYSSLLLLDPSSFGSLAALEYLVRIPIPLQCQREVARLIATTLDIEALVGTLNEEGVRQNSVISKYFEDKEFKNILGEAAQILAREKDSVQKIGAAMMCLMLAERFGDVLTMLNTLLSPPNKPDPHRNFWIEQTMAFHNHYLSKRTHVSETLDSLDKKSSLVRTNRLLLDLNAFEQLRVAQKYDEAWAVAERIALLPSTRQELAVKQSMYYVLDDLVKSAYPSFLSGVMEILHRNYMHLKKQLHVDTVGVVRERLNELREQARLIATLAASAGLPSEQIENLTTLSSLII